ncbi:TetR/AcrR family transcriptional regulator [Lysobacter sp. KIS68-7]|uniref:TetR/AcrR family transcriptional regulator n=1 Tax=Lysobacter sp. KIS68-7 TaxID=2904252 RepID=UPI001E2A8622|nr:TetR/AcrR family transcriptional regulator [Lysobacter sp. KIS68-7]UHQ19871.1 TetR/AcrR family transcriptional regulator [Lysobacter sp. KIS68-7]
MSSQTAPARLTDRKRAAIIDAAVAEFRQSGYAATSMDKVAATAGVSKRTVYNHFPSKEVLFVQILEQLWERAFEGTDLAYRKDRPLRAQLLELLEQKFRLLNDAYFADLARVAIAAGLHAPDLAQELIARMGNREEGMTTWIRAAAADGRLKTTDPLFAAEQMQALVKGFAFWPQIAMGQPPLTPEKQKQVAESAVDMFLSYYA